MEMTKKKVRDLVYIQHTIYKKVLHKRKEKMREKMKITQQQDKDLVQVQQ